MRELGDEFHWWESQDLLEAGYAPRWRLIWTRTTVLRTEGTCQILDVVYVNDYHLCSQSTPQPE